MPPAESSSEPTKVVGGLLVEGGSILLCHRRPDRSWYPDVWDVPGGHLDEGETLADALVRELGEELGVKVDRRTMSTAAVLRGADVVLYLLRIRGWVGEPHNAAPEEHDEVRWFGIGDLTRVELAHPGFLSVFAEVLG